MRHCILIVDDDEFIREVLREMIPGHRIIEAENGARAVELYEAHRPDLTLMDVVMPEMDGIEATKAIVNAHPDALVIGITAFSVTKGKEMVEAGAKEVMSKPVKMAELRSKVEQYLDRITIPRSSCNGE